MRLVFLSLTLLTVILSFLGYHYKDRLYSIENKEKIHIAFVGPVSGKSESAGKSHLQGIKKYIDEVNASGGINGKDIVLDIFDDKNDPVEADLQVKKLNSQGRVVAVIGHNYSSCSIAGGKLYKQFKIPAITPSSTDIKVTHNNEWYFRTVFNNNLQGRFLANYLKKIFQEDKVTIIHEDLAYGSYLTEVFENTAKEIELDIVSKYKFQVKDEQLEENLAIIIEKIKAETESKVLFLATHAPEGVKLVKLIKDAGLKHKILTPNSFSTQAFTNGFDSYPKEQTNPGYYTNGIFVTTPLIFDTANAQAQHFRNSYRKRYNEEPDWHSAYSYDAAKVVITAIEKTNVTGKPETLEEDRNKIREFLASLNSADNAVEGVTGFNYFDSQGDAPKPVPIGEFRNRKIVRKIVSALNQLQTIKNINDITDLESARELGQILSIDGNYMYRTDVVYVGVEVKQISNLDFDKGTATLDFSLWFRGRNPIDPNSIEFLNAVTAISLGKPTKTNQSDGMHYSIFDVQGTFNIENGGEELLFGERAIGFSFRSKEASRDRIIFVIDVLGQGAKNESSIVKDMNATNILPESSGWEIHKFWQYQDSFEKSIQGDPSYLETYTASRIFSRFNARIGIKPLGEMTLRRIIPDWIAPWMTAIMAFFFLLSKFLSSNNLRKFTATIWALLTFSSVGFLLSSEVYILSSLKDILSFYHLEWIVLFFDMLWLIVPAFILLQAVEVFIWRPLEKRTGNQVPSIVRLFLMIVVYLIAAFCILAFVFDQRITSLLATSGLLAMILGLALQVNLSNILSGLALSLERPFKIGDWIEINGMEAAKVIEMNWRAVRLITVCDTIYCIPNSKAADSTVLNYHYPDDYYWLFFPVYVSSVHPPDHVMKVIIDALLETEVVQKQMGPIVRMDYTDKGIAYYPIFLLKGYGSRAGDKNAVSRNIWKHLNRAGMTPAVPRQEIHFTRGEVDNPERTLSPFAILEENAVFQRLPKETKGNLAAHTMLRFIKKGEVIFRQGDAASSMYIIAQGIVSIRVPSETGEEYLPTAHVSPGGGVKWGEVPQEECRKTQELYRLGVGESLREMAMLTCEPCSTDAVALSDCSLLEITRETLAPLVQENPDIDNLFADHLVDLKAADHEREMMLNSAKKEEESDIEPRSLKQWALCSLRSCIGKS